MSRVCFMQRNRILRGSVRHVYITFTPRLTEVIGDASATSDGLHLSESGTRSARNTRLVAGAEIDPNQFFHTKSIVLKF
jgi:hypothetical protein